MSSGASRTAGRKAVLENDFSDPDALRRLAGQIKQHTLDHLDQYLEQAEASLQKAGAAVYYAADAKAARRRIRLILEEREIHRVVKAKSMATEEIHLNSYLEEHGIECVETDLGEFIVQLDGDTPSHIVQPIIHKNRRQVASAFESHGLGEFNDDPEVITQRARAHLRTKYFKSGAGITGANFVSAESGRLVLVTNEGNARFSLAPNSVHIALVGIEKVVPRDQDLAVFLNLLARSATGQQLTVYTQFINGPKASSQPSGPREMHVIFLDNGRGDILDSNCREILRCIRCGACQNVCPVYRQASGHAYRATYGGPVGAVLSPLLSGSNFVDLADLPKASSLCGACREVCPVDIPIPDMLLKLRNRAHLLGLKTRHVPSMEPFVKLATKPALWKMAMILGKAIDLLPLKMQKLPGIQEWLKLRTLPSWKGGEFRRWMKKHQRRKGKGKRV